ncbi:ral guanine nucleotide dissociation stimulator-like 1 isoform X1, partial [Clarias magur]
MRMLASFSSKSIRPPIQEQISELQRKIQLLEGDRSAQYESSESLIQKNREKILQLRQENKVLHRKLAEQLAGDEKVIRDAFQSRSSEKAAYRNMSGKVAVQLLDQKVCDKVKKLNALKHVTNTQRHRLEELNTEYNTVKAYRPGLPTDSIATNEGDFADVQPQKTLRVLENRLEKSQLKCQEAEHITRSYLKLKAHLQEESLTFQSQLDKLECEIIRQKQELRDLQLMNNNAHQAKDAAKAKLQRQEVMLYSERRERELILNRYKKHAEEQKAQADRGERRAQRVALHTDELSSEAQRSGTAEGESDKIISGFEEAFTRITEATGVTEAQDPVQEWGEEVEDGVVYGVTLHREPACPSPSDLVGVACVQYRTLKVRRVKAATLELLITELLNPTCNEHDYARVFLSTYRAFTCTNTLIEMLFQREDKIINFDNSVCVRSSLPALVRLWLDEFSEDLRDSPLYSSLRFLSLHLRHRLCFRRLAQQADALLHTFQEEDRCAGTRSEVTQVSGDETGSVLTCPAQDIAEELTRLDAALFVRVVPFHCLGCVWSQRDKKENRSLAPSVRATIAQFNAVTNRVITSLLCPTSSHTHADSHTPPSSISPRLHLRGQHASPAHRARIIEKWISVAQECYQLRNFSSLRAILSALQSNAVYRLKKTWAAVSKESLSTFDHLCESFPDENCVLSNREILEDSNEDGEETSCAALRSAKLSPSSRHTGYTGGEVPYLGTYLTVLTMLDTALPDTLEDRLINFEKRRREFEVLSQIRQLQLSCSLYCLPSHPHVSSWLTSCSSLSDQQSYDLSRQLEPPVDSCPGSPSWSHRLISKKLGLLLSSSDSFRKKTHSDQMSVSSSGSSGSETDDFSFTLRTKSRSGLCLNISADSSGSCPDPRCSSPVRSSSPSDLSGLSSEGVSPSSPPSPSPSPSPSRAGSGKQSDGCIIRVSMALHSGSVVYKSILINSQDKTSQVIQRALEKHNMENLSCNDFTLTQILNCDK